MARVDLIGDLAIVQGKTYEKLDLLFPGDVTTWTARAYLRKKLFYKEVAGELPLAVFTFPALSYDATADQTLVSPRLDAVTTAGITPSKYQGETGTESSAWVWDLELEDPISGRVIGLDWGWAQVKPEVTADA